MKYLIAYGIGLVIVKIFLLSAPVTKVRSFGELFVIVFFRMVVLPMGTGLTILYLAGKL